MKAHWFYYLVKGSGYIALKLFFGRIKLIGRELIPKDGGVILAPNHQNAFMDAVISGVYIERPISFLTRSDVFNKWSTPILNSLNMIPIYRKRDGVNSLSKNEAIFEACYQLLAESKTLLIFPEGNHNMEYYLRPLAKGTSRIALDATERIDKSTKLYIIPTGINYFSHRRPFAKVIVKYGDPIDVTDYVKIFEENRQRAYSQLREDIGEAMKKTLILPEKDEHYEQKKKWIFQPKHEHLSFEELKAMGEGNDFEETPSREPGWFKQALIAFFSIFNLPPLFALKKLLATFRDRTFFVSVKYLAGGIFFLPWWVIIYSIGALWIGWEAGLLFVATSIVTIYARQSLIKF